MSSYKNIIEDYQKRSLHPERMQRLLQQEDENKNRSDHREKRKRGDDHQILRRVRYERVCDIYSKYATHAKRIKDLKNSAEPLSSDDILYILYHNMVNE